MDRLEVIQQLIKSRGFKTYLEIGVLGGSVFFNVRCVNKIAVDPEFRFNWKGRVGQWFLNRTNIFARYFGVSSDDFFRLHAPKILGRGKLDIVLIDGMHESDFVLRDVENCLQYLSEDGVIILHDCNPLSAEAASTFADWKERKFAGYWNGDVWKSIAYLYHSRADIRVFVADCDHGLGIIWKGNRELPENGAITIADMVKLSYEDFSNDRQALINLQPVSVLRAFIDKVA